MSKSKSRIPKEVRAQVRGIVCDAFQISYRAMYSEYGRIKFYHVVDKSFIPKTSWETIQKGVIDALSKLSNFKEAKFYKSYSHSYYGDSPHLIVRFNY